MRSAVVEAAAHHVTVIASTGDTAWFSAPTFGNKPVKEVVFRPPIRSCWALAAAH